MTLRQATLSGIRLLLLGSAAAATLDVPLPRPKPPLLRCYVLDNSGSLLWDRMTSRNEVKQMLVQDARRGPPDDRFALVVFAGTPVLACAPVGRQAFLEFLETWPGTSPGFDGALQRDGEPERTDIEEAIELAHMLQPAGSPMQMVLLTDGNETTGDAQRAAARLRQASIPLAIIPLGPRDPPEMRIVDVRAPARVPRGSPFELVVDVVSRLPAPATVRVRQGSSHVAGQKVLLAAESMTRVVFPSLLPDGAPDAIDVEIVPDRPADDLCEANNLIRIGLLRDPPQTRRVLYLGPPGPRAIEARLSNSSRFRVDRVIPDPPPFYDLVVLDDIPWEQIPPLVRSTLNTWVQDGSTGLLVAGGPDSLALGGYSGQSIETILPVWASPDERLGLVLLLDRSSSMGMRIEGTRTKLDLAREALSRALPLLGPRDRLAVMAFNESTEILRPLGPPPPESVLLATLRRVEPRLGTSLVSPLRSAADQLASPPDGEPASPESWASGLRHILLVTDGETADPPPRLSEIAGRLRESGITLTIIVTGRSPTHDALAALLSAPDIARRIDLTDWPRLESLVRDDIRRKKDLVLRGPLQVTPAAGAKLLGDLPTPPAIAAANRTTIRPEALPIWTGPRGLPLLAVRQIGAGRTAVLATSMDDAAWGSAWASWQPFGTDLMDRLIAYLVDGIPNDALIEAHPNARHGRLDVTVSLREGPSVAQAPSLTLHLRRPDGTLQTEPLPRVSARTYAGNISLDRPGIHILRVERPAHEPGAPPIPVGTTMHQVPYAPEWIALGRNERGLAALAEAAGGVLIDSPERLHAFRPDGFHPRPARSIWIAAALILLLADLGLSTFWLDRSASRPASLPIPS